MYGQVIFAVTPSSDKRFAEFVERRFVVVAGHVHVIEFKRRRRHVEDRELARLHADPADGAGFETFFRRDHARRPVRAHARSHDAKPIGVDFRALDQIIGDEFAGILDVDAVHLMPPSRVSPWPGQSMDNSAKPRSMNGSPLGRVIFFDAVHAGDVHDAGHFLAGFAVRRQMQQRLDFLAVVGQLDPFNRPAGILNELVVGGAFALLPVRYAGDCRLRRSPTWRWYRSKRRYSSDRALRLTRRPLRPGAPVRGARRLGDSRPQSTKSKGARPKRPARNEARDHYYIAACFYTNAMWAIYEDGDLERIHWQERKRATYDKLIRYAGRPIERVELPYDGKKVQALLHLPPGRKPGEKVPCVMYIPGMDGVKEDHPAAGDPFIERGVALLSVDCPGHGETRKGGIKCTASNVEDVGKLVADYLVNRPEIDADRLGIMASSMGSYWAPRVVAAEKRFKACAVSGVCMEPGQFASRHVVADVKLNYMYMSGYDDEAAFDEICKTLSLEGVTAKITCPYMIVAGENNEHCDMKFVYKLMGESPAPKLLMSSKANATRLEIPKRARVVAWLVDTLLGKPFRPEISASKHGKEVHRDW